MRRPSGDQSDLSGAPAPPNIDQQGTFLFRHLDGCYAKHPGPACFCRLTLLWFGLIALGILGEFALMLTDLLVYRDTDSYTLYGNPWEPPGCGGRCRYCRLW